MRACAGRRGNCTASPWITTWALDNIDVLGLNAVEGIEVEPVGKM